MQLIEGGKQVFIAYELRTDNNEFINGRDIWEEYKRLCRDKDMSYAEKK